jgi:DNA repair exonuclease SbcCD ATPase subunit
MGLFKKRSADTDELDRLRAEIAAIGLRLEASDASKSQLEQQLEGMGSRVAAAETQGQHLDKQVGGLVERLDTPMAPPSEPPPTAIDSAELDLVRARLDRIADRIDEVDQRITSISTELANQISEISGDLESLGSKEPPTDQVVDELLDAQERLANEQARYQIAFRQDLADLADRLKR